MVNFQLRKMPLKKQNLVGPRVRTLRRKQGWTQAKLATHCNLLGWDVSENGVTKIEAQIRCVTDAELLTLAVVLKTELADFFPAKPQTRSALASHFH